MIYVLQETNFKKRKLSNYEWMDCQWNLKTNVLKKTGAKNSWFLINLKKHAKIRINFNCHATKLID